MGHGVTEWNGEEETMKVRCRAGDHGGEEPMKVRRKASEHGEECARLVGCGSALVTRGD